MIDNILSFLIYLGTATVLLGAFVFIYVRVTPYREFEQISQGNSAAAITLAGAVMGFTFPLMAAIFYTRSLEEMIVWAGITCLVQLFVFLVLRKQSKRIEGGHVSTAIMVATFSIAIGLLNAVSISH